LVEDNDFYLFGVANGKHQFSPEPQEPVFSFC
jgi:hypothetical protein